MGNWKRVAAITIAGMILFVIIHDSNYNGVLAYEATNTIKNASVAAKNVTTLEVGNKEKKSWNYRYDHVDRKILEASCTRAKECPSSEQYWIVCGNDGVNYRNLGMLACAQWCKIDLKFKGFGPCENSVPQPFPTFPQTETRMTSSKPVSRSRKMKEIASDADLSIDEDKIMYILKNRIRSRYKHHGEPKEVEMWCREHPDECPYGFDPTINHGAYFIPAVPYDDNDFEPQKNFH